MLLQSRPMSAETFERLQGLRQRSTKAMTIRKASARSWKNASRYLPAIKSDAPERVNHISRSRNDRGSIHRMIDHRPQTARSSESVETAQRRLPLDLGSCSAKARTSSMACWRLCRRQSLGALSRLSDKSSASRRPRLRASFPRHELRENHCGGRTNREAEHIRSSFGNDDHLARVGHHDDAPCSLADWPAHRAQKKTPFTRKIRTDGAAIANFTRPS